MPFDATPGRASFALVSRIGDDLAGEPVRTHWVFYAESCRHLADVFIQLTPDDTVVVDPTRIQGQVQSKAPPSNEPVGPVVDLSGERGVVFVTAEAPNGSPSGQLVGGWTLADLGTGTGFGGDALGLGASLPDPALLDGGLAIQAFDPASLQASIVVLLGVEETAAGFRPITRALADAGSVCCDVRFTDTLEQSVSLPQFCFGCAGFTSLLGEGEDAPLLPPGTVAGSAGFVLLDTCVTADEDGTPVPLGTGSDPQFLFAFHGQAVGTFGVVATGKYRRTDAVLGVPADAAR
jgi:hypothetical protein